MPVVQDAGIEGGKTVVNTFRHTEANRIAHGFGDPRGQEGRKLPEGLS